MPFISEKVVFESPGVLEKLTGEMPYKRLVGDAIYMEYSGDEANDSHLTVIGATDFWVDTEDITVNQDEGTIEFPAYDGTYLIRKITTEDSEWASEEDLMEAQNGNF